jgi:hypothetical protein
LFARKVLNNGHASVRDYLGYGSIYHLFSRTLYGQIEKGNLRNRRKHSFEYIRTRLVLLDFILANPDAEYLETEHDKVAFFCEKLSVAKEFLPGRLYEGGPGSRPTLRYFVDKFPPFVAAPLPDAPPVVTLSFVDSGLGTIASFLTHLATYRPLFRHLQTFRFLYISPTGAQFARATERFCFVVKQTLESDMSSEVLRYFQVRQRFEKRHYGVSVTEDSEFLNEAKCRFHGDRFERRYRNTQRTRTKARVLPDGASSNCVFRDVPRDAASLPSAGKRTRHGERGMKDTDHFLTGVPFTSAVNGSIEEH